MAKRTKKIDPLDELENAETHVDENGEPVTQESAPWPTDENAPEQEPTDEENAGDEYTNGHALLEDVTPEGNEGYASAGEQEQEDQVEQEHVELEAAHADASSAGLGHNAPDFNKLKKELLARARKFGSDVNKADGALPALALDIVSAAANGYISVSMDGKSDDDVAEVYGAYLSARVKQKDVTAPAAQISKLRAIAKVGWFLEDAGATLIENANDKHVDAYNNPDSKPLMRKGSRYDFLVDVARAQLQHIPAGTPKTADIHVLDDTEVSAILFPGEKEPKTAAEQIKRLYDAATKIIAGKQDKDGNYTQEPVDNENLALAAEYLKGAWFDLDPKAAAEEEARIAKAKEAEQLIAALGGMTQLRKLIGKGPSKSAH